MRLACLTGLGSRVSGRAGRTRAWLGTDSARARQAAVADVAEAHPRQARAFDWSGELSSEELESLVPPHAV